MRHFHLTFVEKSRIFHLHTKLTSAYRFEWTPHFSADILLLLQRYVDRQKCRNFQPIMYLTKNQISEFENNAIAESRTYQICTNHAFSLSATLPAQLLTLAHHRVAIGEANNHGGSSKWHFYHHLGILMGIEKINQLRMNGEKNFK